MGIRSVQKASFTKSNLPVFNDPLKDHTDDTNNTNLVGQCCYCSQYKNISCPDLNQCTQKERKLNFLGNSCHFL